MVVGLRLGSGLVMSWGICSGVCSFAGGFWCWWWRGIFSVDVGGWLCALAASCMVGYVGTLG